MTRKVFFGILVVLSFCLIGNTSWAALNFRYPDRIEYIKNYYDSHRTLTRTVKRGDTLWTIFKELGILKKNISCLERLQDFYSPKPGDCLKIVVQEKTALVDRVELLSGGNVYLFGKSAGKWTFYDINYPVLKIREVVSGVIDENMYTAGIKAGLHPGVILDLSDIFSSDVDFNTDLRRGDIFVILLEKEVRNGRERDSRILAARMVVQGESFEAFYFNVPGKGEGYYDRNGNSKERFFLKAPLQYRRISSYFTARRFHPILKIYRPHYGIDYAAPAGTPVSALGDGVVTFAGWKGGYGKYVEIRHGHGYKTTYGHLSRFARGIRAGKKVKRGELIGYVGSTGLATGPHLDFRFYVNGKPVNFLKTKWPHVTSVPRSHMARFRSLCDEYVKLMDDEYVKALALARAHNGSSKK
ncbi:peptidoglycan DD-metalloendopeptidase family protein [Thermodesulforhabdus norvegica]|uniref:Murein DD-endopeptidase MepM and murein hydrolase activator NlpD, contain LysM domain n=1 Tax=Thermodesulforhabdus norvegica TaxID=39841 RepID=A0A1I4SYE8_9BACT|nr:peptidoglycan DD-metalloendopeptidase family protein [Thermodesulforhabdus norvegica]SFM69330.1 Murein DD-endopeptidase MepM and murein hydrolase activator NlpD, contain LysM domain [Thermodesulforhabdus norvegica]